MTEVVSVICSVEVDVSVFPSLMTEVSEDISDKVGVNEEDVDVKIDWVDDRGVEVSIEFMLAEVESPRLDELENVLSFGKEVDPNVLLNNGGVCADVVEIQAHSEQYCVITFSKQQSPPS